MKRIAYTFLKELAGILILAPLVGEVAQWRMLQRMYENGQISSENQLEIANTITLNLYIQFLGAFCLVLGVILQWWLARKTKENMRAHWILMFVVAALLCFDFPFGTVLGGSLLIVLFKVRNFRKMLRH